MKKDRPMLASAASRASHGGDIAKNTACANEARAKDARRECEEGE